MVCGCGYTPHYHPHKGVYISIDIYPYADMRLRMFAFVVCGWLCGCVCADCVRLVFAFVWRGRGVKKCKFSAHWISVGLGLSIAHCHLSICPLGLGGLKGKVVVILVIML